jgi:short subunit dehydrogenase-like uncharacterized protein
VSGHTPVVVYGASGHTGSFVVDELLRRGIVPIASGRDVGRLDGPSLRRRGVVTVQASTEDAESMERAFAGAAVVVNCAGPFLDTAQAVIESAIEVGAHYVDVTAEQASVQATFAGYEDSARQAGVTVVPAMGFFGGLTDLLATAASEDWVAIDRIDTGIFLDSWHPTTGTRRTGERNTVPRVVIEDGELVPLPDPPPRRKWSFPPPVGDAMVTAVPLSEVPILDRHLPVSNVMTYLNDDPLTDLADPETPPPLAVDGRGRSAQRFVVDVHVTAGSLERRAIARGRDIYAITAPLVAEATQQLLSGKNAAGVLTPGELLPADATLERLAYLYEDVDIGIEL